MLVIFKTIRYLFLELFCAGPAIDLTGSRLQLPRSTDELGPLAKTIPQNPTPARQSKGDANEGSEIHSASKLELKLKLATGIMWSLHYHSGLCSYLWALSISTRDRGRWIASDRELTHPVNNVNHIDFLFVSSFKIRVGVAKAMRSQSGDFIKKIT